MNFLQLFNISCEQCSPIFSTPVSEKLSCFLTGSFVRVSMLLTKYLSFKHLAFAYIAQ
jgi:hypothetical protein